MSSKYKHFLVKRREFGLGCCDVVLEIDVEAHPEIEE